MSEQRLVSLHHTIDERVNQIRAQAPEWPCAKGCDHCCRSLADLPQLTATEWDWLQQGLTKLAPAPLAAVRQRLTQAGSSPARPVTCPLLDPSSGACMVYHHRPLACRTYGFYLQRGIGLYCDDIRRQADQGAWPYLTWGNQDGIDREAKTLGAVQSLFDWFQFSP